MRRISCRMGNTSVMTKNDPAKIVSRSTIVPAPAQAIFDLLADPRRHQEIDGSGSIQSAQLDAPERLSLNATFGMKMKIGLSYKITNTVVEFAEEHRLLGVTLVDTSGVTFLSQLKVAPKSPSSSIGIRRSRHSF